MSRKKILVEAVAYMRTSSATNVGTDKDFERRQRAAIEGYAKAAGYKIVDWFYDAAVSGADPVKERPGFADLLARVAGNGVRVVIVETANRFARDLMVQEVGFAMLQTLGIALIAADSPASFLDDGPTAKLIRQILGAVAEFDKTVTVAKLRAARDAKRAVQGKCEGRKPYVEHSPAMVAIALQLAAERLTLREIAGRLFAQGFGVLPNGAKPGSATPPDHPFPASSIRNMLMRH